MHDSRTSGLGNSLNEVPPEPDGQMWAEERATCLAQGQVRSWSWACQKSPSLLLAWLGKAVM